MILAELRDLYRHMEWADASVWRAVFGSESALSDKKLRDYFYHLHLVQRAFIRAWRNEPANAAFPTFEDMTQVRNWGRSYYDEIFSYLERLSDEEISQPMRLPWAELVTKQLGREDGGHRPVRGRGGGDPLQVVAQRHRLSLELAAWSGRSRRGRCSRRSGLIISMVVSAAS